MQGPPFMCTNNNNQMPFICTFKQSLTLFKGQYFPSSRERGHLSQNYYIQCIKPTSRTELVLKGSWFWNKNCGLSAYAILWQGRLYRCDLSQYMLWLSKIIPLWWLYLRVVAWVYIYVRMKCMHIRWACKFSATMTNPYNNISLNLCNNYNITCHMHVIRFKQSCITWY